ncbi:MAG: hypothetical protein KZQ58_11200 [gamma proteobacterium symbiont of Bathyaustriella thionipta]|nr:hypothetical protein [gamma proteobacterium symbiont of Bathyaustriella thionipta]
MTETSAFTPLPGRWERHLQRKQGNPLFAAGAATVNDESIRRAQHQDRQELTDFMRDFEQLVMEVASLDAQVESDVVLELKSRLDQAWEKSSLLAGDQSELQNAIEQLLAVIMLSIRQGAADDPKAQNELKQEEEARRAHFELLKFPLIGDLLDPDSVIKADELLPTLLSEPDEVFYAAAGFFDEQQCSQMYSQGLRLLQQLQDEGLALPEAWNKLQYLHRSSGKE